MVSAPVEGADPPGAGAMADRMPCYWHDDIDGTRYLIPGCMARIQDPDIDECTCPRLDRQLAAVREALAELRATHKGLREWTDQIVKAVYAHPDGVQIMRAATNT